MVAAAEVAESDVVLEIGPGLGMLTRELVGVAGKVIAVEVDRDLAPVLHRALGEPANLEVIQADALDLDLGPVVAEPYLVVASLPYHIATPLLFKLAFSRPRPRRIVAMVQEEVARRLAPGNGPTTYLSVAMSSVADARIVRRVGPGCFFPMPRVQSAVIRFDVRNEPAIEAEAVAAFLAFLRAGFTQPRKQLHNSLAQGLNLTPADVQRRLRTGQVDSSLRPGQLSTSDWLRLFRTWEA